MRTGPTTIIEKERFALAHKMFFRNCGITLANHKKHARRACFGMRPYCTAFLLLLALSYLPSARAQAGASAFAQATADRSGETSIRASTASKTRTTQPPAKSHMPPA